MKKYIADLAMLAGTIIAVIFSCFGSFASDCERLSDEVVRLHILANSDSEADQQLKYELRDYIISLTGEIFGGCAEKADCLSAAREMLPEIERQSREFVEARGYSYPVSAEITELYFTTRQYGDITMPAGSYDALRIVIGSGGGKNWWCVLFPPLCLSPCEKSLLLTEEQSRLIENGGEREIKFALYEFLCNLFGWK